MNWDIAKGNWHEFKGRIRRQWGKLTEDDLEVVNGEQELLLGLLQKRYGMARDSAKKAVDDFCATYK